jgi:hypothetical protein
MKFQLKYIGKSILNGQTTEAYALNKTDIVGSKGSFSCKTGENLPKSQFALCISFSNKNNKRIPEEDIDYTLRYFGLNEYDDYYT